MHDPYVAQLAHALNYSSAEQAAALLEREHSPSWPGRGGRGSCRIVSEGGRRLAAEAESYLQFWAIAREEEGRDA